VEESDAVTSSQVALALPEAAENFPVRGDLLRLVDAIRLLRRVQHVAQLVGQERALAVGQVGIGDLLLVGPELAVEQRTVDPILVQPAKPRICDLFPPQQTACTCHDTARLIDNFVPGATLTYRAGSIIPTNDSPTRPLRS
jgi:hypothetical protein